MTARAGGASSSSAALAILAVAGGLLWGWCFLSSPPPGVCFVALAPLFWILGAPHPARNGFLHGLAFWTLSIWWIAPTVARHGGLPRAVAVLALLLLAAYLALFTLLFAALGARLWRRGDLLSLAALPALWLLGEWLRERLITGFPWNVAAHAWIDVPGALPLASWIGAAGVGALGLVPSLGIARALARRRIEPAALGLLSTLLVLALAARWAAPSAGGRPPHEIRIVQPDIPVREPFDPAATAADTARLFALSERACDEGALVVWPESASWPAEYGRDAALDGELAHLLARGCAVLFNSIHEETSEKYFNSAFLVAPGAPVARYDKRHLVPFGEYVPLGGALPFLTRIARAAGDFHAAERLVLLPWAGEELGPAVCYEVIFPAEVAAEVRAGATLLVTITNDAWYGDTAAPRQHLAAARFRAAENRRWLLRAAITGISAVVAPDGAVRRELGVGEQGILATTVDGRTDLSPFARAPWLVPAAAAILVAAALARDRVHRGPGGSVSS